jgi:hypothetical protein
VTLIKKDQAKLAKVKQALAKKYEHLAQTVKSKPRRKSWNIQAARFRRQAADLAREAS